MICRVVAHDKSDAQYFHPYGPMVKVRIDSTTGEWLSGWDIVWGDLMESAHDQAEARYRARKGR